MLKRNDSILFVVAGALFDRAGRVLVQRRPAGGIMAGLWEFPGGKVEPHERPEAALVRELSEELGIVVEADCLAPLSFASAPLGDRHLVMLLYRVPHWAGEPSAHHAEALGWVAPGELDALPMPPADRPLVAFIQGRPIPSA